MTFHEGAQAVAALGFTERQARFLATVMANTGVCVPRQYATFCRIVHGQKTRVFFAKLVRLGYASMHDCRHNRARVYHVNHRALYRAVGDPDSPLRRPPTLAHAIQRLMILDAIVEDPDLVWLGTAEEKTLHLTTLTNIEPGKLPHSYAGSGEARTARFFPDRLPIGIHPAGRAVLVYVIAEPRLERFRAFLERHRALLRALPAWTLRIVVPPHIPGGGRRAKQVVHDELLTPLSAATTDELRWFFGRLHGEPEPVRANDLDPRFRRARTAFSGPQFKVLYRRWKEDGDDVLAAIGSRALDEAVAAGSGLVETLDLGHRYGHLAPLVATA